MDEYTKIDLHIHSSASGKTKSGDRKITENSDIDNIEILVNKLIENEINMCAITDHNIFDKDLYLKLKEYENRSCLKKVLPGVELDLSIEGTNVHVVVVFDDTESNHADMISNNVNNFRKINNNDSSLKNSSNSDNNKNNSGLTLSELGSLLAKINLNVVLIVHQKSDISNRNIKNNLGNVGIGEFSELICCEYFDCLEIQNSKIEGILNRRFHDNNLRDTNFIIGSDCHEWTVYPKHDKNINKTNFTFTVIKALPTFRGLVMAITSKRRISTSKFSCNRPYLKTIKYKQLGVGKEIELSYGINVIIGDNSVGKSSILNELFGAKTTKNKFFEHNHIEIDERCVTLAKGQFKYYKQGDIRALFDKSNFESKIMNTFKKHFSTIDTKSYSNKISTIFSNYKKLWEENSRKKQFDQEIYKKVIFPDFKNEPFYPHFEVMEVPSLSDNSYYGVSNMINTLLENLNDISSKYKNVIEIQNDISKFEHIQHAIEELLDKYEAIEVTQKFNNEIQSTALKVRNKYEDLYNKLRNNEDKEYQRFNEERSEAIKAFLNKLNSDFSKTTEPYSGFEKFAIDSLSQKYEKYTFITKIGNNETFSEEFIDKFLSSKLHIKDIRQATIEDIEKVIDKSVQKGNNSIDSLLNIYKKDFIDEYMNASFVIKREGDDFGVGNSQGTNALYYLDLCRIHGIFKNLVIIDQPEDDVAQSKINSDLINILRRISDKSQIIIVTHNPQLVVNLDVDNVIIMTKSKSSIDIESGPLELKNDNVDILHSVAEILDGGTECIRQRWKRYEKNY